MKHLMLTIASIMLMAYGYSQMNISVGPNAGFGHTWMSGSGDSRYQPAGNFGVAFVYSHNNHVGLGVDFKYSIEGGKKEFSNIDVANRLNYIRIPVKGIYFFRDYGASFRPKISFGPSFGFLVGGKQEAGSLEIDAKEIFKTFDVGLLGSAGFHYNLVTNTWLHFDVSYYHGLADVSEASETQKNRNIGVNLGVAFGIGGNSSR